MGTSLLPLISRLRKKILRASALADAADASETLSPAITIDQPPVIHLADELERIVRFNQDVTLEQFVQSIRGGETAYPATVIRFYRHAVLADGAIYANGSFETFLPSTRRVSFAGVPERLNDQMLVTDWIIEKYFGHWLLDGLTRELLAEQTGHRLMGIARRPWDQEAGYRKLTNTCVYRPALAQIEGLWVVDDSSMNQSRRDRLTELRRRIRSSVPPGGPSAPIFLRRVGGACRPLLNQDHLADALARRGFTILTPETEPVDRLVRALHGARLVVSVEGSALCHATAAMAEGGTVVAIQPPRRVDCIQKIWTDCAGLRLAQTVADDRGSGFELSEDRLMRLCDLVATA